MPTQKYGLPAEHENPDIDIYQYLFCCNIHTWLPEKIPPSHFNPCKLYRVKQISRQTLRPDWHVKQLSGSHIIWQCSLNDDHKPCFQGLLNTGDSLAHVGQICLQSHIRQLRMSSNSGYHRRSLFWCRGKLDFKLLCFSAGNQNWLI